MKNLNVCCKNTNTRRPIALVYLYFLGTIIFADSDVNDVNKDFFEFEPQFIFILNYLA